MKWIFPTETKASIFDSIVKNRKIDNLEKFLNPSFSDLHNPFLMYGMEEFVEKLLQIIEQKKKIYIHGDFDVDGITGTSILWRYLYYTLKADVTPYIPNRFTEGYGLSEESINTIINKGGEAIISVDCGIKDIEIISQYSDKIDFFISDHHTIREYDPTTKNTKKIGNYMISSKAKALIHPSLGNKYPFPEISGSMVAWKICSALSKKIYNKEFKELIELAALGTVCDIMPLLDENRAIVSLGLRKFKNTSIVGLKALMDASKVNSESIDTYHFGFILGPRINASGRLGSAMDAVRLLTTNSLKYAQKMSKKLSELNLERQDLTKNYLEKAEEEIKKMKDQDYFFVFGENWPEGIVGLIAGKLAEKYFKPVIVGSLLNGIIKASARSIENVHIANLLNSVKTHLITFGGHAQAAGLSMEVTQLEAFQTKLSKSFKSRFSDKSREKTLVIDAIAKAEDLTPEMALKLNSLAPFGHKNPQPIIAVMDAKILSYRTLGYANNHLKIDLLVDEKTVLESMFFNFENQILEKIQNSFGKIFCVAGNLELNTWNKKTKTVLRLKDMKETNKN